MAPKQRSAAREILAALDADPELIEHYDPIDIEAVPLAAIHARLIELGLSPTVPTKLQRVLFDPPPSPAVDVLRALADDLDCLKPQDVEVRPLAEVTACLQRNGINYRAGVAAIVDFMGERSFESANIDKDQTRGRSIKWLPLRHSKSLFLVTIGSAATATAAAAAVGFFVTKEARQDKLIHVQGHEIQELSVQVQQLKARLKELTTGADNLISLTIRVSPSGRLEDHTWPKQMDGSDNASAVSAQPEAPPRHGVGDQATAADDTRRSANVAVGLIGPTPETASSSVARAPQLGLPIVGFMAALKRLELLHALAPKATRVAILVNPANGPNADETLRSVGEAARSIGLQTKVLNASTSDEIDAAFASLADERADDVLFVASDGFLQSRSKQLVALTARDKIPAAYPDRAAVAAGGLMSYGTDIVEMYREVDAYRGNILKGAKPTDLPVPKFEFVINRNTAKALGLDIPLMLRVYATELID
jgi:hypothetical protein